MSHPSPVLVACALLLACASVAALSSPAQEILTNESILTMVRAGLPESVIIAKMRSSQTRFDLSTNALISLKQAGVPDGVLEAMTSQGAAAPPAPGPTVPAPMPQAGGVAIYYQDGDKLVELNPVAGRIESTVAPFFSKQELVISRRRAQHRIVERQPTFRAANFPPEAQLARLRPGGKDDRNLKVLQLPPFGGTTTHGPEENALVKVTTEREAQGWVLIRPRSPLRPGEYGFVLGTRIWDFGID